jgi:hypothetical protein
MIGLKDALADTDPNAESVMIPLYNEFIGHVDGGDFDKLSTGWAGIQFVRDLQKNGYVDDKGNIKEAFFKLEGDYIKLILSEEFMPYQKEVYDIMWKKCDHFLKDCSRWFRDVYGDIEEVTCDEITNLIKKRIEERFGPDYSEEVVGLCHSGSGDPYIQAINKKEYGGEYLKVESLVLVGTPLKEDRIIMNPNVKTVVVVNGENDTFGNPFLNMLPTPYHFTHSQWVENIYNFKIKDAEHEDYFYDPKISSDNDTFRKASTKFIAKVTALSRDNARLIAFIRDQKAYGAIVENGATYQVDVERIIYGPNE